MAIGKLRLGKDQLSDLHVLCALGEGTLKKIVQALETAPLTIRRSKVRGIVAGVQGVGGPVGKTVEKAVDRLIIGLATACRRGTVTEAEILDSISLATTDADSGWTPEQVQQWTACRGALKELLEAKSIRLSAKAADLVYDFDQVFIASRILTDVRPIFRDPEIEPFGAAITQTLRLEYFTSTDRRATLAMAMDSTDIEHLKNACERALRKGEATKKLVSNKLQMEVVLPSEELDERR